MSEERKVALITGASRGIGRAIAICLAKNGMNTVINYAGNKEKADETVEMCKELGVDSFAISANIASAEEVESMVNSVKEKFGRIDVLVNNAGITKDGFLMSMKEEDMDSVFDTNLKGTFLCSKYVSKIMLKQKYGRIVNMASVVGIHGNVGQTNYAASKGGVIAFTKSLAKELAKKGITVNAVAPGFIETDMTNAIPDAARTALIGQIPMARTGSAEDVANLVAFLTSDSSSYITGQVIGVDGGMGM